MKASFPGLLSLLIVATSSAGERGAPRFNAELHTLPPLSLSEQIAGGTLTPKRPEPNLVPPVAARPVSPPRAARQPGHMPVLQPDPGVDYKMRIIAPDAAIDFKLIVCEPAEAAPAQR